jgi:hypothetical protein
MIGMLVRDQNAGQTFGRAADLRHPFPNLFSAEPGIDEDPGLFGFDVRAIPR